VQPGEGQSQSVRENAVQGASTINETCTAQNYAGIPITGTMCGGLAPASNCSPGILYACTNAAENNCTLQAACDNGCIGPAAVFGSTGACYTGPAPLTISPSTVVGGDTLAFTATTEAGQGGIVNLIELGLYIAEPTDVPIEIPQGSDSVTVELSTSVVKSQQQAAPWVDINFGSTHIVSLPQPVTITGAGGSKKHGH